MGLREDLFLKHLGAEGSVNTRDDCIKFCESSPDQLGRLEIGTITSIRPAHIKYHLRQHHPQAIACRIRLGDGEWAERRL